MSIQIYDYQEIDIMNHSQNHINLENRNQNRLYLAWKNADGNECKMIGPQTKCFCNHRFKQHQYLNPVNGKTHCKDKSCKCKTFEYIPTHGAYDFKCLCKHSFKQHNRNTKKCQNQKCTNCNGFSSAWTCSCGQRYQKHSTVSETLEQRKKLGKSTNDLNRMASQLQNNIKQGSLYRPIKQDRQSKIKKYSQGLNKHSVSTIQNEQVDGIQEIQFHKSPFQRKY